MNSNFKLTLYNMVVQPSIVTHWNTVSIAKPILSKLIIPKKGPSQFGLHSIVWFLKSVWLVGHTKPFTFVAFLGGIIHGTSILYIGFPLKKWNIYFAYFIKISSIYPSRLHSSKDASKESILFGSFISLASHLLCIIPQNNSNPIIA